MLVTRRHGKETQFFTLELHSLSTNCFAIFVMVVVSLLRTSGLNCFPAFLVLNRCQLLLLQLSDLQFLDSIGVSCKSANHSIILITQIVKLIQLNVYFYHLFFPHNILLQRNIYLHAHTLTTLGVKAQAVRS